MTQLDCTPFLPNSRLAPAQRLRRLTRRLALVLAPALVVAALGCREDTESPSAPEPEPTLDITPASALAFRQVSAGGGHTCAVTTDDRAYCWGNNWAGELGDATTYNRLTPVAVLGGLRFRSVSAGQNHTCGVTTDDRAYCWGYNLYGHLGDGTTTWRETPVAVAGGLRFRRVDAGSDHTCGVTTDDRAYCWGYNPYGQLGDGTTTLRLRPVAVAGRLTFKQVSTGLEHTCAVTPTYRAYCWGRNQYGQIGDSTEAVRRVRPSRVAGGRQFRLVDAGGSHTCGVTTGDRAFCWGNGRLGEIGNGKTYLSFWPRAVAGGLSLERVTAGAFHTCGETTLSRAYCWGAMGYNSGQLGDGTTTGRLTPVAVAGGLYFSQVSAGTTHTCAKTSAGVAYCWGWNFFGQVGDGTTTDRLTPVPVAAGE